MTVAFVISAYKEPELLRRLVLRLAGWPCAVHIDAKVDVAPHARALAGCSDVTLLPRHVCHWGLFGHVAASLDGLRWFLGTGRDHVVLLTGQCYPLRPIAAFESFLDHAGPVSIISHDAFPHPRWMNGGADRINRYHVRMFGRAWHPRLPFRQMPFGLTPYGGASYWCLSRAAAAYMIEVVDARPELIRFFNHVWIPDEIFFQTLLANSPLKESLVNDDVHYIEWTPHQPNPKILTDAGTALRSGKWFGRKFADEAVLDRIDAHAVRVALSGADAPGAARATDDPLAARNWETSF